MYGVSDIELTWFTNYLSGRQQVVSCNGELSGMRDIKICIPQGSTLGPTLFLVINDIISSLKSARCSTFCQIYISHKNLGSTLGPTLFLVNDLYMSRDFSNARWYNDT